MKLKLSEAMRLGAMALPEVHGPIFQWNVTLHPDGTFTGTPCGACAIGAALYAAGAADYNSRGMANYDDFAALWPWTQAYRNPFGGDLIGEIVARFESHGQSREQIAAWLETIEPAETETANTAVAQTVEA